MKTTLCRAFVLIAVLSGLAAHGNGQSSKPESLLDDFIKAWNTHNMKGFDKLFTDDAIWVPLAEQRFFGRENIVKDIALAHTTWAQNVSLVKSDVDVKTLSSSSSVIFFHAGFIVDGQAIPNSNRALMIVVVKKKGHWKIAAGQLDHPTPPAAAP